jgi:radical SAM protein with 4Fe4S-binding SPASM domain
VEISLYGRRATHDAITDDQGSFDRTLAAIGHLQRFGVPVTIKTPLMSINFKDRAWLTSFAFRRKIARRFDPVIAPRNNGDMTVLQYRLTPTQLETLYRDPSFTPDKDALNRLPDLSCSAGENLVAIGADGSVYPCLQLLVPIGTLKKQRFAAIWSDKNKTLTSVRKAAFSDLPECNTCIDAPLCQRCPGLALLENGAVSAPSRIACTIAEIQRGLLK